MSSIDERVVSMKFDNRQFQQGVSSTMSSLDKLKSGLNLSGATKGLNELDAAGKRFSLANIAEGVDNISSKFTALSVVGVTALANITSRAVDAGLALVKSLTVAPIADGMNDYLAKLSSVQTIMNATGSSIDVVSGYFGELDTYADKTIYNLTDMTGAFAKFTNAGVDMDKSVPAIKGIANMVALAGQDAGAASIAMYNLSQSIAGGFLTTTDYKSLNLANVATKEWKNQMIEGALAAGKLKKTSEGLYEIPGAKGAHTDQALFNEQLSEGWASTEVLMGVLGKYGDTTTEIGKKAQAAAQDVKSYGMMMETLTAGVGTSWTDTFEIVFGNIEEAKALWTPLTNTLGEFLTSMGDARNDPLVEWKSLGGRTAAIDAIKNAFTALVSILKPIKEAFREIFPPTTGAQLMAITEAIRNFTAGLKLSSENSDALKRTFKGVFAVFDIAFTIISQVVGVIFRLIGAISGTGGGFLQVTGTIGDFLVMVRDAIKSGTGLETFFRTLGNILLVPIGLLRMLTDLIGTAFKKLSGLSMPKIDMPDMPDMPSLGGMASAVENLKKNLNPLAGIGQRIADIWGKLGDVFRKVWEFFAPVAEKIGEAFKNLGKMITDGLQGINYDQVLDTVNTGLFAGLILLIKKFIGGGKKELEDSGSILDGVKDILGGVTDTLGAMQQTLKANVILKIAIAIALLAVAVIGLATVDSARLETALMGLAGIFTQLMIALAILGTMTKGAGFLKLPFIVASLIGLSIAINLLVIAVKNMSGLSWDELLKGLAGVGGLLVALSVASRLMSKQGGALLRTAASLILISTAIRILVTAVRELGEIDKVNLTKGLIAVAGLLGALALYSQFSKTNKGALSSGAGLILLGVALKIIADVVDKLGSIDKVNLIKGVAAITVILGALAAFSRTVGNPVQLLIAAAAMVVIGKALESISEAVWSLGAIDKVNLIKGLGAITAIMLAVSAFSRTVGNPVQLIIASAAMLIIGAALKEIADSVWVMGSIDKVNLIKGLGAITAIMLAVSAFSRTVGNPVQLVIASAAMLIIGAALKKIASAVYVMGAIDKVNLIKGLGAITAILAAIAIFNQVSGNPIKMAASAAAMIILGVALNSITEAVGVLGSMSLEQLAKGLVGMGAALVIIALAMSMMPLTMLLSAAALVVVAAALTTLGDVMVTLGGMSWEDVAQSLVMLAGSLVIIAGAMFLMTGAIPGAIALGIVAAALSLLAPVLVTLGDMSWEQILTGLAALAGVFLVIGVAGALLTPVIPTLLGLGIAISLLGVGAVLAGAGMLMFAMGLTAIGLSGAVAIPILIELVKQIILLIPFALEQLGLGIVALAGVIAAAGGPLTAALVTLILALLTAINTLAPQIVSTVMNLIWLLLNTLMNHLPNLIDMGFNLVVALLDGVARNIPRVINSAVDIIVNFINGIANNLGRIIDAGVNLIIKFMDGINQAIPQLMQAGADMIIGFVESLATTIRNNQDRMNTAGKDLAWAIADGMTGGLASKAGELADKAANMAKNALDAAKNFLGIASPSKEFFKIGAWTAEGMGNGIEKNAGLVGSAAEGMGSTALNTIKSSMSKIADAVDSDMDMIPTIRPVLDLSSIKKDAGLLGGILGTPTIDATVTKARASFISDSSREHNADSSALTSGKSDVSSKEIQFIQNNYSPKALSEIDIYRQTRNQLSTAKGA